MAGFGRTREHVSPGESPGTAERYDGRISISPRGYGSWTKTDDILGNHGGQNSFSTSVNRKWGGRIVGDTIQKAGGKPYLVYKNYVPSCLSGIPVHQVSPDTSGFKDITSAIADSHPGDSGFSLPNFLYELKDVPRMLQNAYRLGEELEDAAKSRRIEDIFRYLYSPKARGRDWLNYNFGYRPFLQDARSIAEISDYVSKRCKQPPLIRRRRELGETFVQRIGSTTYTALNNISGVRTTQATAKKWVCSRWRVDRRFTQAMTESRMKAVGNALGLNLGLSTVWNALGYSWLIDWFTGVGDVIDIYENKNGIKFDSAVVMLHTRQYSVITAKPTASNNVYGSLPPCYFETENKTRNYAFPSVVPTGLFENFLGAGQLATLASLAVTRR